MSTPLSITTSKSALMHACLAYLSPEVGTIDDIISDAPTMAISNKITLPTEIILLIREYLFPLINTELLQQSTTALEVYESNLRNLLCPDCLAYNLDIYGPCIWQWEQFTGACACIVRSSYIGPRPQGHPHHKTANPITILPNPNQFTDVQHWLEWHLSREAALRIGHRGRLHLVMGNKPMSSGLEIWDLVALVLRDYRCEVIREPEGITPTLISDKRGGFQHRFDLVKVVQRTTGMAIPDSEDKNWRAQAIIRRATRELCLEYTDTIDAYHRHTISFNGRLWYPNVPNSQHSLQALLDAIISGVSACLSFPATIATVALTILCFYSRPRSFRII